MVLKIYESIYDAIPSEDKLAWIRKTVSERLKQDLPEPKKGGSGKRISIYVEVHLADNLKRLSAETGRSSNEIFSSCLASVAELPPKARAVEVSTPKTRPKPEAKASVAPPKPKPGRPSKKQKDWLENLERRLAVIRADMLVGRWGVFCITGGSMAVKPYENLDSQGIRDFDEEIRQGLVVQEIIPWEYSPEEAVQWLAARNHEGKPLSWYYISGDSESLNDAEEARCRSQLKADGGFPETIEALTRLEREEALEREAFGRKRYYLDWAVRDRDRLLQIARRDGRSPVDAVPKNIAYLAERAESPLLLGRKRILEIGMS